jgi:hypothetical protein
MCPFCIGTALWIAAGAIATTGVSALAVTKLHNKKPSEQGTSIGDNSALIVAETQE